MHALGPLIAGAAATASGIGHPYWAAVSATVPLVGATLALKAGVAMKVVSDRLGHSTIAVTANLYTHVYDDVAHEGADRIAAMFADESSADVGELLAQEPEEEPS